MSPPSAPSREFAFKPGATYATCRIVTTSTCKCCDEPIAKLDDGLPFADWHHENGNRQCAHGGRAWATPVNK